MCRHIPRQSIWLDQKAQVYVPAQLPRLCQGCVPICVPPIHWFLCMGHHIGFCATSHAADPGDSGISPCACSVRLPICVDCKNSYQLSYQPLHRPGTLLALFYFPTFCMVIRHSAPDPRIGPRTEARNGPRSR